MDIFESIKKEMENFKASFLNLNNTKEAKEKEEPFSEEKIERLRKICSEAGIKMKVSENGRTVFSTEEVEEEKATESEETVENVENVENVAENAENGDTVSEVKEVEEEKNSEKNLNAIPLELLEVGRLVRFDDDNLGIILKSCNGNKIICDLDENVSTPLSRVIEGELEEWKIVEIYECPEGDSIDFYGKLKPIWPEEKEKKKLTMNDLRKIVGEDFVLIEG